MKILFTQLIKTFSLSTFIICTFTACNKDDESKCAVTSDDYIGTYYGEYAFSIGGSKLKDTIIVSKSTDSKLDLYSHVMGSSIYANTSCEKFNIETFTDVSFDLEWAKVLNATGSGNGQYDKNNRKIKVAIKFSVVKADIGTGPSEYKNMIDLTGDFIKQ